MKAMETVMLSNSKKANYYGLRQFKNLRKVCSFAGAILLICCIFAIFCFCVSNNEIANADSSQNSNVIQNAPSTDLYLVGEFTDWKVIREDKYRLDYDNQKGWYKKSISYTGSGNCDWKIIWQNDWSNSWGGTIEYTTDQTLGIQVGQCVGLIGNKNLNPPNSGACNFDVYWLFGRYCG